MQDRTRVDLHLHTTASDGVLAGDAVIDLAHRSGIDTISITDHDSIAALPVARAAAAAAGVRLIPGVEISAWEDGASVHVLGYFIDPHAPGLEAELAEYREARFRRAQRMVERLRALGLPVDLERVLAIAGPAALGRPHIAEALLEMQRVETFQDAFDRYIGVHRPAYVPRPRLPVAVAIDRIRASGGVAGVAHPATLHRDHLIPVFARAGLAAIEVWHPRHDAESVRRYARLARDLGLVTTGGSDYHGGHRGNSTIGDQPVPAHVVEQLADRASRP